MEQKNTIKVYTSSKGAELNISAPSTKQLISATNNKAQYFAEQAMKYRDEAKSHRDKAKYYAEQNSNVTFEYISNIKNSLEDKINEKQPLGDYALKEEIPMNVSEFMNDANYVNQAELNELRLPEQDGHAGCFLMTDGNKEKWMGLSTIQMFDTILKDHLLTYEESKGLALQGTYVYKDAIAGSRYGYPDFYNKCLEEYAEAERRGVQTITLGGKTIGMMVHPNGHMYYDAVSYKSAIDDWYNTFGSAWFYGIDSTNQRIFLPRNDWFEQCTADISNVGYNVEAGIPNITGSFSMVNHNPTNHNYTGAFTQARFGGTGIPGVSSGVTWNEGWGFVFEDFNASASNSIYGKSSTVQPKATKKLLYICVGNTTNYKCMTDVVNQGAEILNQVAQKVNIDGTNLNSEGKILFSSYAMPSNKFINLSLGATNSNYTAPANGYFYIRKCSSAQGQNLWLQNVSAGNLAGAMSISTNENQYLSAFIPAKKGQIVAVEYTVGGATQFFRFIYAEGEQ